jgi:hypothetical protein
MKKLTKHDLAARRAAELGALERKIRATVRPRDGEPATPPRLKTLAAFINERFGSRSVLRYRAHYAMGHGHDARGILTVFVRGERKPIAVFDANRSTFSNLETCKWIVKQIQAERRFEREAA